MSRPEHEVADVIRRFGEDFVSKHHPNRYQLRVLRALSMFTVNLRSGNLNMLWDISDNIPTAWQLPTIVLLKQANMKYYLVLKTIVIMGGRKQPVLQG